MLLDLFTVKYQIDSADAERDVQRLQKKTKDVGVEAEGNAGKITKGITNMVSGIKDAVLGGAKGADILKGGLGTIESTLGKITEKAKGMGGSLGSIGGLLKGPGLLAGGMLATATVAVAMIAKARHQADEAAERLKSVRKDAWDSGMTERQYLQKTSFAEQLGINPDDMKASLTAINSMAKGVLLHRAGPLGGIDMHTGQDTDPMSRLMRKHKINLGTPGSMRTADQIYDSLVTEIKRVAETKGRNAGMAIGQKFGFAFDAVQKIVDTPMEGLQKAMATSREYAAQQAMLSRMTIQYTQSQKNLELIQKKSQTTMDLNVVPAVTRMNRSMAELTEKSKPLVQWISKVTAAVIDMTTGMIDAATKLMGFNWNEEMQRGQEDFQKIQEANLGGLEKRLADLQKMQSESKAGQQGTTYGYRPGADYSAEIETVKKQIEAAKASIAKSKAEVEFGKGADVGPKMFDKGEWEDTSRYAHNAYDTGLTAEQVDKVLSANKGASQDVIVGKLEELVHAADKGNAANQAQLDVEREMLPQIVQNTSVGLEQALAMWAGGIGRAGGIGGTAAGIQGQSRADFERRSLQTRFMPDPTAMRLGAKASEQAQSKAGYMNAVDAMDRANVAASKGQRMREEASLGASRGPQKGGDLIFTGDVNVEAKSDDHKSLGETIGRGMSDMMGGMRKEIANTLDSVFKA